MPGGRPPKYKTPEELEAKIDEYFESGIPVKVKVVGNTTVEVPVPTITGLALYLGFADRYSMYDYEKKEEFSHSIKKARAFIEKHYEELLQSNNVTGAIFALKNFGWKDKQEIEHGATDKFAKAVSRAKEVALRTGGAEE